MVKINFIHLESGKLIEDLIKLDLDNLKVLRSEFTKYKLFYELVEYTAFTYIPDNLKRSNVFKEILNIEDFIKNDKKLVDIDYINHHNFLIKRHE